jgi:GT2 family glycosyltransferase
VVLVRASIVVVSHNEGESVRRTVEACLATTAQLDAEVVLVDDASTDGSAEGVIHRFPEVELVRHERRRGAAATKATGAGRARGDVLVFLDGHSNPELGAIAQLVEGVEQFDGEAILTPAIATLDVASWRNDRTATGHGYRFDLRRFECQWLAMGDLRRHNGDPYYESPALIGCAFAMSRELYQRLRGFDARMRSWGVEDLDLALKAWLSGGLILHDPAAVIGHRFRTQFDNYTVPPEDVIVNQLRMARKHFTHSVWEEWVAAMRASAAGQVNDHPEGAWADAWHLFELDRSSAEEERSYLQARRVRDEFWYARRFGLAWPSLSASATGATVVSPPPAGIGQPASRALAHAAVGPSAGPSPSPSPAPSRFTINGPADVPGLAQYQYAIALPAGKTATGISWHSDKATATFKGATNTPTVTVVFAAGTADWVTLTANFTLDGAAESARIQVAVVRVQVSTRLYTNPGRPNAIAPAQATSFLVTPPAAPTVEKWVTTHTPGSAVAAFTYNGNQQAAEPASMVRTNGATPAQGAFVAQATVKLTAPAQKPTALQRIQVGFIQAGAQSGTADYPGAGTPPTVHHRQVAVPTTVTVDWLSNPPVPASDDWPWYDVTARDTGSGTTGTWARTLTMTDSPAQLIPSQANPNGGGADKNAALTASAGQIAFTNCIAARTLDTAMQAHTLYFDHGHSTWSAALTWPVAAGASAVTFPAGDWIIPATPTARSVNVVPTIRDILPPYLRWLVTAKFIDRTPDVTADAFWGSHEVLVVRVAEIDGDPAGDGVLHTEVVRRLNSTSTDSRPTFAVRDLWLTPDPEARDQLAAGDTLVLYLGDERPIVAEPVTGPVADSPLVTRLAQIASLRLGEGGAGALRASTLHADPRVAQFALRRLIADPAMSVPADHEADLRRVRNDESSDPEVRLLAAQLLFEHDDKGWNSDEAYEWLRDAIAGSALTDWTQIAPLVHTLAGVESRRRETVPFLVRLAIDEDAPEAVRIAAYSGFEAVIDDATTAQAREIADACLQLLQSASPAIRQAGATLLYNLSVRGAPAPLDELAPRAAGALAAAQATETEAPVRAHLANVHRLLTGAGTGAEES